MKIPDFITFPKTFENYRWYKPIIVLILTFIIIILFQIILVFAFNQIYGEEFIESIIFGGYETLNTDVGEILTDLSVITLIPSLFIASKIVRDRPFSSYASSRGGFNIKLFIKALIILFIFFMVFCSVDALINGPKGTYHFSFIFLIITLILVPLQCIAEEYVFRGLIFQSFGSWFTVPLVALILQAIFFAVSHSYNIIGIIDVFVSGIIFGFFAWKTNGIEVSSAFHTANNLSISLFIMFGLYRATSTLQLLDSITSLVFQIMLAVLMYWIVCKTDFLAQTKDMPDN